MNEILVLNTTATLEQAEQIATSLVDNGEAACVNIVSGMRSIYRWEGKTCNESEYLLLIKSKAEKFEAIRARIKSMHSYAVPEIIAFPITMGDDAYLSWLASV